MKNKNSKSEYLFTVDLFGGATVDAHWALGNFHTVCAVCGKLFLAPKKRGRPIRFCGDQCRIAQASRQKRDWEKENRAEPVLAPTECAHCSKPLMPRLSGAGRVKKFCSVRCVKKSGSPPNRNFDEYLQENPRTNDRPKNET